MKTLASNQLLNRAIILTMLAASLAACGGGGGSTTATTTLTQPPAPTTPSPTISPTSNTDAENAALNLLNQNRTQCGFGPLTRNAALDITASNHANYMALVTVSNKYPFASHEEIAQTFSNGTPIINTGIANEYFSGETLKDRLSPTTLGKSALSTSYAYQGYGENIALSSTNSSNYKVDLVNDAKTLLTGLFAAPYHIRTLVYPQFSEVGINYQSVKWTADQLTNYTNLLEIVSALPSSQSYIANTKLLNFPCDGVTTAYELTDETPNPFGEGKRDLKDFPIGQPVYVLAPYDKTIASATATITENGVSVGYIHTLTQSNDPNQLLEKNEVVFMPDSPLKPNTKYQVSYELTYTTGDKATNSFSFNTQTQMN